jgi:hypothetical protein
MAAHLTAGSPEPYECVRTAPPGGEVTPHSITIPQAKLNALKAYTELAELSDYEGNVLSRESDDVHDYGLPPAKFAALVDRLKSGYDWRTHEAKIKAMGEHLRIPVRGLASEDQLDMHVIHRKSGKPNAIPVILVHGWPGTHRVFCEISDLKRL